MNSSSPGSEGSLPPLLRAWDAMPVAVRAVVSGFAILILGGSVGVILFVNLKLAPAVPVFLPATLIWLWLVGRYLSGWGWPRSTSVRRRDALRARKLPARTWLWALVAGGCAVTCAMGMAFVTYRVATLPDAAYASPFEGSSFPPVTLVSIFAALALTAAVVEEAAFRGYMLSGLQSRHGWVVGIGAVTVLFYVAHLSHAYATLAFLPFFLAHGLAFGLLVYYTRSILPGVVLHALSDFIVLPMQYGVIPSAGRWPFVGQGWMSLVTGLAAIFAFRQLRRVVALERLPAGR